MEPTAKPQGYIVYTRIGYGGFDNGVYVRKPEYTVKVEPGLVYSFKVTAVNKGGESFPSEILSAYKAKRSKGTLLIVNGFDATSGPEEVNSALLQGFDLKLDPGIPYGQTPAYCGYQQGFNRDKAGLETGDGLGVSDNALEGRLIAGNTYDYVFVHGKAIQRVGRYSFVSCSDETLESGSTDLSQYDLVDLICGADAKSFSSAMQETLTRYCRQGGRLLVSGSAWGANLQKGDFGKNVLKCVYGGRFSNQTSSSLQGAGVQFQVEGGANETVYAVPSMECVMPVSGAYSSFVYTQGNYGVGTVYRGEDYRTFVLGFPLECVENTDVRNHLMQTAVTTLLSKKRR